MFFGFILLLFSYFPTVSRATEVCVHICLCEHTCAWCAHAPLRISARTRVCVHARAEVSACMWAHVHGAISAREQVVWYDHGHVPTADVTPSRSHSCSCP